MPTVLYLAGTPMWAHIYGIRNGLRALGADVLAVGTPCETDFHRAVMAALGRFEPKFAYDVVCAPDEPIDRILDRLERRPDLILYVENSAALLPRGLASVEVPTMGLFTEDFSHADWEPDFYPYFDIALTTLQQTVDTYRARGHDNVAYWYLGGVDAYHRDFGLPRVHDVCLIGGLSALHRARAKTMARLLRLKEEGVSVLTGYGVYFEDYGRVYSQSKIVFNRSACDQLNMRVLEAAACGALVITNRPRNPRDPSSYFLQEGQHVVYYDSDDEAVELVRHYLRHDREREAIAAAGRDFVLTHHTYAHVARALLEEIVPRLGPDFLDRRRARLARWGIDAQRQSLDCGKHFYLRSRPDLAAAHYREAGAGSTAATGLGLSVALAGDLASARTLVRQAALTATSRFELARARAALAAILFHGREGLPRPEVLAASTAALRTLETAEAPASLRDCLYFPPGYDRFRLEISTAFWTIPTAERCWERVRDLLRYQLHRFQGIVALEGDDSAEALVALGEAAQLLPDDGQVQYELARTHLMNGDRQHARRCLERAVAEDPFHGEANQLLASLAAEDASASTGAVAPAGGAQYRPGISAIVHTLNEEAKIEDALKSLQGWVDEIIVCDMYSDDRTVEIARPYTDRIIFHKREVVCAEPARNFAIAHARHQWLFLLDADERVTPALATYLRRLVDGNPPDFDALAIPMDDRWMGGRIAMWEAQWPRYKSPQLIRNGRVRFPGYVHAAAVVDGKTVALQSPDRDLAIVHFAWDGLRHWMTKINRYTDGEAEKLDAAGQRFRWRQAVRSFVEGLLADSHRAGFADALDFIVAFSGANYRFYQHAKLHERHAAAGSLAPEEREAPLTPLAVFEYALEIAREIVGGAAAAPAPSGTTAPRSMRQRFSLYHTEGREDDLKAWMAPYADLFKFNRCDKVLDVGCGPGLFLELLRDRGIAGHGVDSDPEMVAACQQTGLSAAVLDAAALTGLSAGWNGIHLGHIVEHMHGEAAIAFLETCAALLRQGGLLLIRTPNWGNEQVRHGGFWLDHTHVRPYPLELLERILLDLGLEIVDKGFEPGGWQDAYIVGRKPAAQ